MSTETAKAFEEKLLTIDLVDGLRREQERLDAALDDGERMQELRSEIQAYYSQAGIVVSGALIDKAIAERQQQRLAFKPPKLGTFGHVAARAWIYRGRLGATAATVALVATGGWYVDQQLAERELQQQLAAYRAGLQQQANAIGTVQDAIEALPGELGTIESTQVSALPGWVQELQTAYRQAQLNLEETAACGALQLPADLPLGWDGEAQIDRCHAALPAAQSALADAQTLVREHRQLETAVTSYGLLQQRLAANPVLGEWRVVTTGMSAATAAAAPGSSRETFVAAVGDAETAVSTIARVAPAHTSALACLADGIAAANTTDDQVLTNLRSEGEALRAGTMLDGIETWSRDANATCTFFAAPLRLRIVSEPGEQTGVWRYYDGNRGARTYYVVVDALSAGGTPVAVPFQSAEDQRQYRQARFAVRVSEAVYERVRADKQDDGVLRDAAAGAKSANSLQWQLPAGFEPSFIAEW